MLNEELKVKAELYYKRNHTNVQLPKFDNLIKWYLPKKKGKIIDIGCGQSLFILDFLDSEFELYANDDDSYALELLKQRIADLNQPIERVNYILKPYSNEILADNFYSAIVLTNFLHFFCWNDIIQIVDDLKKHIEQDGVFIIKVHSTAHPSNKQSKPLPTDQFKHFFKAEDLRGLFPDEHFEFLFFQEDDYTDTLAKFEHTKEWVNECHKRFRDEEWFIEKYPGMADYEVLPQEYLDGLKKGSTTTLTCVFQKK